MKIQIADMSFEPLINPEEIDNRIKQIAAQINADYEGRIPVFIGVLNGSFIFVADLVKELTIPCEVTFSKLASYFGGIATTHKIRDEIDISIDITGRDIILVEDIVDSGNTLSYLIDKLKVRKPASISACSLLLKPKALERKVNELKYIGFEIENEFVVGYGLDYKELGRNVKGIYKRA